MQFINGNYRITKGATGFFYSLNVEVTGAARLYRAASVWTAGLGVWLVTCNSFPIAYNIPKRDNGDGNCD